MKRVFIGIPLSKDLQELALEWQRQIKDLRLQTKDWVRWTAGKNLHVTLVPPWNTSKWKVESEKLKVIKFEPFEMRFSKIAFGPNPDEPRMIWATGEAPVQIKDLRLKINDVLGQRSELRPFRLHATLARFRPGLNVNTLSAPSDGTSPPSGPEAKGENSNVLRAIDWRQIVDRFVLFESHLSSTGTNYQVLEEF